MTRLLLRHRPAERALLAPTVHAPAARHLQGVRRCDDAPLDFADLPPADPFLMDARQSRWTAAVLLHGVPLHPVRLDTASDAPSPDGIDAVLADILAAVERAPFARHEHEFVMALAPVAALLAEPAPATDWAYLLGAVESGELTAWSRSAAERAGVSV